jgi:hypothetical protein
MRKREEVEKHLKSTGYSKNAVNRILAFLVGAGVKEFDEQMIVKYGDGTWAEFYEWWQNENECDDCVFCDLMDYLCEQHNKSTNEDEKEEIGRYIEFLIDAFGDDNEIEFDIEDTNEE